jgi:hypothetical protein
LITATGNITGGNLIADGAVIGNVDITGNIDVDNITATGFVSAVGNVIGGNVNTATVENLSGMLTIAGTEIILNPSSGNIDMSGSHVHNVGTPQDASDAATKQYVDDAVSTGIHIHTPVLLETPTPLPAATYALGGTTATVTDTIAGNTVVFSSAISPQVNDQYWFANSFQGIVGNTSYFVVSAPNTSAAVLSTTYNGVPVGNITSASGLTQGVRINAGVGATLTGNTNAALSVDGVAVSANNRILVYQQSNAVQNGVYSVTQSGNISAPFILTRATDSDRYAPDSNDGMDQGSYYYVQSGDTGAGESYVLTQPFGPFIIGYANIEFTQFSASQVYSANTQAGLVLNGTVFSAKVDNDTTAFDGTGNIIVKTGANLVTPNIGNATGNSLILGGNGLMQSTTVSATGNVIGGNFTTLGNIVINDPALTVLWANGQIDTAGPVISTGNVTGGNILTGGLVSATGTGTFGNITIGPDGVTSVGSRITVNSNSGDVDFAINGDTVANAFYVDAVTGTASFGNAVQTINSIVAFNSTTSILVPVGATSERPIGVTGQFRFNTTSNSLEIFDNSEWVSVGVPVFTVIDDEQFNGDGSTVAFTLGSTQTTNSCIVSINGVVQIPTLAYSVSGTDPTCVLTFTEAPAPGDIIDVRLLTTTISVTSISNSSGNARISVNPTEGTVNVTGNIVPTANLAFNLGSPTNQWNELYISGNSIYIGDVILKANNGNLKVRNFDDTADAGVEGTFISTSTTSGNIQIGLNHIEATNLNGNIDLLPNGVGMVTVGTQLSAVGNITGSYIFGNGSQLTGIDATSIQNGTSNVRVVSSGGNITTSVGGTANVVVVSTAGATITGNVTATSNMVIGTAGNSIIFNAGNNFEIQNMISTGNINFRANVNGGGPDNVFRVLGTGGIAFAGNLVSMFGNGAVANGIANIGSPTSTFNTIFAKATSAQYADLAEKYVADAEYAPGVVVEFGGTNEVTVCNSDSSARVAGVISTNPSYRMNDGLDSEFTAMVALTGRVPTHVVGPVRKGDMMVAAGNGRARAEADPKVGSVIGKALADFDGTEGVIEVVVGRV